MHVLEDLRAGRLDGATRLDLREGLTAFPPEIFRLADTLEVLDLSGNALEDLPDDLPRLRRLRILFCSSNRFTRLPAVLGRMPALRLVGFRANAIAEIQPDALSPGLEWLILTGNELAELPPEIGRCTALRKLALAGNRLRALPEAMAGCTALELLRVSANGLDEMPTWLTELPRLAWLGIGGNPLTAAREAEPRTAPRLPWAELRLHGELGTGASGVVHRAEHRGQLLAAKVFKGGLTSDGWARSEVAAGLAAGAHPHLIGIDGVLDGHPDGAEGVALPLLDAGHRTLAGPPSFTSCTRDVYAAGLRFTSDQALAIVRSIARAVEHLHSRQVLHGDLYAHNIRWNGAGDVRLGDFGAASLLPAVAMAAAARCEVRAFGYLLEELAERTDGDLPPRWQELQQTCLDPRPERRPSAARCVQALS